MSRGSHEPERAVDGTTVPSSGRPYDAVKRCLDVAAAAGSMVVLSPLLLLIALAVRLTSKGPAIYRAKRAGLRGAPFDVLKFRSMAPGADRQGVITVGADDRVTPLGRLLRRTKLDELPQLWNILRGEMSVVGPRPESLSIVEDHYTSEHRQALSIRPGLTCTGNLYYYVYQEHLRPPPGVGPEEFYVAELLDDKLAADLHYVHHRTLAYDLRLIAQTLWIMSLKILGIEPRWRPPIPLRARRSAAETVRPEG